MDREWKYSTAQPFNNIKLRYEKVTGLVSFTVIPHEDIKWRNSVSTKEGVPS